MHLSGYSSIGDMLKEPLRFGHMHSKNTVMAQRQLHSGVCFVFMQGEEFENQTRDYWCPMYYNDMGTLMFNSQETVIKQLFHLNGRLTQLCSRRNLKVQPFEICTKA